MSNWNGSIFRKLHLDYHQPPWIPGVAATVTPEVARQQARLFRECGVEAVEFFAHDHHDYCFFPAEPPGRPHPGLALDYLGNMTAALKAEGLRTIAYVNVYTNVWLKYLLNSLGRRRSQTAYELAPRGSVTPAGPHLLRGPHSLRSQGRRRSQTAYELAPRGSVTPAGPHLLRRHWLKEEHPEWVLRTPDGSRIGGG